MTPTIVSVDLTEVEASYVPHAIGLLGHVSQNQGKGLDTLQARHTIEWGGVTIVTVTTVTWLKQDRYDLAIAFEHGVERDLNFFRNYPDLEVTLKDKLIAPGWRMRPIFDLDAKGISNVIILPF